MQLMPKTRLTQALVARYEMCIAPALLSMGPVEALFLGRPCCSGLRGTVFNSPQFQPIFRNTVYAFSCLGSLVHTGPPGKDPSLNSWDSVLGNLLHLPQRGKHQPVSTNGQWQDVLSHTCLWKISSSFQGYSKPLMFKTDRNSLQGKRPSRTESK